MEHIAKMETAVIYGGAIRRMDTAGEPKNTGQKCGK
jgi:hypothetical protein